jgi:mannose-binding lectin 2
MAKYMRTLLFACILATVIPARAEEKEENVTQLRTHSIYMPYIDQDLQNRWFDFGADTVINTNRHIRLTHDNPSQTGWLWSRLPLTAVNFQVEFEFKVDGHSANLYGDGFAFWLTKERALSGPVFGGPDRFTGLGIFFDTYPNNRAHAHSFPYVMAMIGDGYTSYQHDEDGADNEVAGCEADFRAAASPTKARVTYYRGNYLELKVQWRGWEEWDTCFTIPNVTLPSVTYLGFSAITGEISDNHDIISVTTTNIISVPQAKIPPPEKHLLLSKSTWWTAFKWYLKLVAIASVGTVIFLVYRMYSSQNNKRF